MLSTLLFTGQPGVLSAEMQSAARNGETEDIVQLLNEGQQLDAKGTTLQSQVHDPIERNAAAPHPRTEFMLLHALKGQVGGPRSCGQPKQDKKLQRLCW